MITLACTLFPSVIRRVRPVALTFLATALVLVMDNINALFFLLRNDTAKLVFDEYRIATAQVRAHALRRGFIVFAACLGKGLVCAGLSEEFGLALRYGYGGS